MGRATLLVLTFTCLVLATRGQEVSDCEDVKCAWMEEKICPGEFLPQEPSEGRCCSICVVTVGESKSHVVFLKHKSLGSNSTEQSPY
jgi:hypothetical protein